MMSFRTPLFAALALALSTWPAGAAGEGAVEAVRAFYVPPFEAENEPDRFTGAGRAALERGIGERTDDEVGCIDFSIALGGQDYDEEAIARTLHLTAHPQDDGTERVTAEFTLFDEPSMVVWEMREVDGAWKVADVSSEAGQWRLSGLCE